MPLPIPEPGLVISYSYLWHRKSEEGKEVGSKNRPCVLVLLMQDKKTLVAPIAHSVPSDLTTAIPLPSKTARRLGLDDRPMWVICSEVNAFVWPGPDLRPVSTREPNNFQYGMLPPKLFEQTKIKILSFARGKQRLKVVGRNE